MTDSCQLGFRNVLENTLDSCCGRQPRHPLASCSFFLAENRSLASIFNIKQKKVTQPFKQKSKEK
jgi:hypothetical protein